MSYHRWRHCILYRLLRTVSFYNRSCALVLIKCKIEALNFYRRIDWAKVKDGAIGDVHNTGFEGLQKEAKRLKEGDKKSTLSIVRFATGRFA